MNTDHVQNRPPGDGKQGVALPKVKENRGKDSDRGSKRGGGPGEQIGFDTIDDKDRHDRGRHGLGNNIYR